MVCPKCKKILKGSPTFCGYCGYKFVKSAPPVPPEPKEPPKREPAPAPRYEESRNDTAAKCPWCGSTSLQAVKKGVSVTKAAAGALLVGPIGLLAGGIGANNTKIICLNCGREIK